MDTVRAVMKRAAAFRTRHAGEPRVGNTYGYFTHHPVAPVNRARLRLLLDELGAIQARRGRPLRVLDLACGGGLISSTVAAAGHRVLGLDLDADEIRLAELFAREADYPARFRRTDLLADRDWERDAEKILEGPPDVTLLAYALHHLPGVEAFVTRLAAGLVPGAILLINEENPRSPLFRLKHVVRGWLQHDTETEWHRTYDGWRRLLEAGGLRVSEPRGVDPIPGLPAPLRWSLVFTAGKE
jgi:2-polyprenyl-3-methyl-5-hydroxy-6-metoxy-1,4-benzoquinol methylase